MTNLERCRQKVSPKGVAVATPRDTLMNLYRGRRFFDLDLGSSTYLSPVCLTGVAVATGDTFGDTSRVMRQHDVARGSHAGLGSRGVI